LNNTFIGITKNIHEMAVLPQHGKHLITVVDQMGNEAKHWIVISE